LIVISCSSVKLTGSYDRNNNVFVSKKYNFIFRLPKGCNWKIDNTQNGDIIFNATDIGKLIYVYVAAESLNSSLEDYFLLLKL